MIRNSSSLNTQIDEPVWTNSFSTPLGEMVIFASSNGICLLEFVDRSKQNSLVEIKNFLNRPVIEGENEHISLAKKELVEYFEGSRKQFDVTLDPQGTEFQKQVWDALLQIPFGKTASYQEQALKIGNLKAIRAVATANGSNKIAIVVPCHRVIGKDGSLTGYAGGLERKRWLLQHEQKIQNGVLSLF